MRKENLKRKGIDDGENVEEGAENEEETEETSPVGGGVAAAEEDEGGAEDAKGGDTEEEASAAEEANDNTAAASSAPSAGEKNGDAKESGTDDEFEDAETGEKAGEGDGGSKKAKENGGGGDAADKGDKADGEEEGEEEAEAETDEKKAGGRAKAKPAKKATNGDAKEEKENGDGKDEEDVEAEEEEEEDEGNDKNDDADSDYDAKKNGAGKRAAAKKKTPAKKAKKAAKPPPKKAAKKTGKQKIEEDEEDESEEEEYEVESIIDHRKERGGKMVYRIRWKNYGKADDTWEPEATLSCPDLIKKYKAKLDEDDDAPVAKKGKAAEEYEVEAIIDHRKERGGKMVYRIRWKNYGKADDTWEPESTLSCPDLIRKYKASLDDDDDDDAPLAKKGKAGAKGTSKKGAAGNKRGRKPAPKRGATKKAKYESDDEDDDDDDEDEEAEYEVERIIDVHFKRDGKREYLVRWKGFSAKDDTWEPAEHLSCSDLIKKFNEKLDKSKNASVKELRVNRKHTERLTLATDRGRKTSRRNANKARVNYYDGE